MSLRLSRVRKGALLSAALVVALLPAWMPASAASSGVLSLITEPDDQMKTVDTFILAAKSTLDMTMYELADTTAQQDLAADARRGVKVRVILDQNREKTNNQAAFDFLNSHGVQAVWAPAGFKATHQKTITDDGSVSLVLSGNLTSRYYPTSRDFGVVDHDASDVAAIEKTFAADFAGTSITPPTGTDLVWSPTNSQSSLLALIAGAKTALSIENEEMGDTAITNALVAAAKRGVKVSVTMTNSASWTQAFDTLAAAGVQIATYAQTASLYIHAKVIIADGAKAFVGSENFSDASLNGNRELGLITPDAAIVASLAKTLAADHAGGTPWK